MLTSMALGVCVRNVICSVNVEVGLKKDLWVNMLAQGIPSQLRYCYRLSRSDLGICLGVLIEVAHTTIESEMTT